MNKYIIFILLLLLAVDVLASKNSAGKAVSFDYENNNIKNFYIQNANSHFHEVQNLKPLKHEEPTLIGTFMYDLNGDGKDELFVYFNDHLFCGTHGCTTKIIDFSKGKPVEILDITTYHKIYVLNQKTNGYNNIGVKGDEETHIKPDMVILYWNGIQYSYLLNSPTK